MKLWAAVGLVLFLGISAEASIKQSWIHGMDEEGTRIDLPSRMCVIGGQVLRIGIGIEDRETEERWTFPIRNSVWRMTRSSGFWEQWDARQSAGFGPFRFGDEDETVYMWIPLDIGHWGKLEAMVPGYRADLISLVDNYWNEPGRCEWPDEAIYVSGPRPDPTPTPVPTPTPTPDLQ